MRAGTMVAEAARNCVDTPFRPQGRDPAWGLDCVGLVAAACAGRLTGPVPAAYPQRGGTMATIAAALDAAGLRRVEDAGGEGDILLLTTGPAQWHLAVRTDRGFVHADARLRRVVEVSGAPAWPVAGAWRVRGDG